MKPLKNTIQNKLFKYFYDFKKFDGFRKFKVSHA